MNVFMKYYNKITIKLKLLIIVIIVVVYPIIIIGYFGYANYARVMKEKYINYSVKSTEDLSLILNERIESLNSFSQQILYDETLYNINTQLLLSTHDLLFEREIQENFNSYLNSVLFSKPELTSVLFRFSQNKRCYNVSRNFEVDYGIINDVDKIYDYANQFSNTDKGNAVWYISHENGVVKDIYFSRIVYNRNNPQNELGILIFKIKNSYLFNIFENFSLNNNQNINIYTNQNIELFKLKSFDIDYNEFVSYISRLDKPDGVQEIGMKNKSIFVIYKVITPLNWKLVVSTSSDLLLSEVKLVSKKIIFLCIITIPLWFLLINYIYIDIIRPMNLLIKNMRKIENGNFGVIIQNKREDELGYLFSTFNKMSLHIKNLINTVYKEQIAMKDAQIKALQAQINPHFLYNTLEAINWKAKIHGADEIADMVSAFSCIIEANLNRSNQNLIPVYEEIQYIKNYNFLMQKRFGDKIKFDINVDDEVLYCKIPKLLIQPLVENAIYHGLEMKKGGGIISIEMTRHQEDLSVKVSDNGFGITEKTLLDLSKKLQSSKDLSDDCDIKESSKIGIINVHKRVRLLYGDKYGLQIHSKLNEGTSIVIILPMIEME